MKGSLSRFLGDTLLRTIVKLAVISFVVGVIMAALDLTVLDVFDGFRDFVVRVWNMGFAAIERFLGYFLLGAAIVVPVFVVLRLLKFRRG